MTRDPPPFGKDRGANGGPERIDATDLP
jgi:hypothetical protein